VDINAATDRVDDFQRITALFENIGTVALTAAQDKHLILLTQI
jgi:hypothetical protein